MSYTTRRSGGVPGNQQANSVGKIGQRRPVVTNNFVPGESLTHGQAKMVLNQQRLAQSVQNNPTIHFRNQQQQQPQTKVEPQRIKQQPYQNSQQSQQRPPYAQTVEKLDGQQPQQQLPIQAQSQQNPPQLQNVDKQQHEQKVMKSEFENQDQPIKSDQPPAENDNGTPMDIPAGEQTHPPKRRFWFRRNLPRREMIRRRNFKLSKLLKPKNAVAILNELVKNITYEVENTSNRPDGRTFKASVFYDDIVHEGFGFTEDQAKNGVAEVVLKHYIKSNKIGETKKSEDGTEPMELGQEDENAHVPLPWQHVASFAIYKLFSQWDEDPSLVGISASYLNVKQEIKSPKKMPPNPETINPLMLLNQMVPNAKFEEIGRSGNPPQIMFSFRCTIDDQFFIGSGTNKRVAKRAAAFEACHKVLGITYPPEIFVPSESTIEQH